jgi:hypothetical protein
MDAGCVTGCSGRKVHLFSGMLYATIDLIRSRTKGENTVPEVTVVIPLFNKGPYIGRALSSVLNQGLQNIEILVVDDGSSDDGPEQAAAFCDQRVRLIRQSHGGVSSARNNGIRTAGSHFIAFLDADDEWHPGHLETLLRLHASFPGAGICATSYMFILPDGSTRMPTFSGFPGPTWEGLLPDYFRAAAMGKPPVFTSAAGAPKKVLLEAGLFAEGVHLGEDLDLWGRIALEYPVAFSHFGPSCYRKDAGNRLCRRIPRERELPFVATARAGLCEGTVPDHLVPSLRAYCCKLIYLSCRHLLRTGRTEDAALLLHNSGFEREENGHIMRIRTAIAGKES